MRTAIVAVLGIVGGFIAGIVLAEVIAIATLLALGEPTGVPYLSIILAVVGGVGAPLIDARYARKASLGSGKG
ncbi:DUF5957 family protein [Nocardiopsis sediminis]|uniref:DUF5957 family protein n=1 Tax=Nocardiopsis sediminis TaxID=1778267 RepID=A0ABV8FQM4_9ACTN